MPQLEAADPFRFRVLDGDGLNARIGRTTMQSLDHSRDIAFLPR